jgi:arginine exporter protein ArgO
VIFSGPSRYRHRRQLSRGNNAAFHFVCFVVRAILAIAAPIAEHHMLERCIRWIGLLCITFFAALAMVLGADEVIHPVGAYCRFITHWEQS